jgi:hypothetical protein
LNHFRDARGAAGVSLFASLLLAACQSPPPQRDYAEFGSSRDAVTVASGISQQMRACWFGGARLLSQLLVRAGAEFVLGRPRVLVVQKSDPGGLPNLWWRPRRPAAAAL